MFKLTRHQDGPILRPDEHFSWETEGVFNPGVVKTADRIVMLYRAVGEREAYISHFGLATSTDGVHFTRAQDVPVFGPSHDFDEWATEDPRISAIGDDFYVTYVAVPERIMVNGVAPERAAPLETSTALLRTRDFLQYENLGVISPADSDNKDIVLFPKKIAGRYCMLHRPNRWNKPWCNRLQQAGQSVNWPCDLEQLPEKPGIWIACSDDLIHWDNHRVFLEPSHFSDSKIGPGLPPIETPEGWLLIYHHVSRGANHGEQHIYSIRAALLDLADPTHVIGKLNHDILWPEAPYETENGTAIVFPTGGFISDDTLYVYYGASDRYVGLATGSVSALMAELRAQQ